MDTQLLFFHVSSSITSHLSSGVCSCKYMTALASASLSPVHVSDELCIRRMPSHWLSKRSMCAHRLCIRPLNLLSSTSFCIIPSAGRLNILNHYSPRFHSHETLCRQSRTCLCDFALQIWLRQSWWVSWIFWMRRTVFPSPVISTLQRQFTASTRFTSVSL